MFSFSSSDENGSNSLAGVIWRRVRWWNRRGRVCGQRQNSDVDVDVDADGEEQFARSRRRRTANIYKLSGAATSTEEMMIMDRNEDETIFKSDNSCGKRRKNDSAQKNCTGASNRFGTCNYSNSRPGLSSYLADCENPVENLEPLGSTTRVNDAGGGGGVNHGSGIGVSAKRASTTGNEGEETRNEFSEESKQLFTPQPEQWRVFAPASRACRLTFVFDPAGKFSYYWSLVVSLAFLYNLWVIAYRFSFDEITSTTRLRWFCSDYICDFIYLLDIAVQFRTGFLEDGVLQTNPARLRVHYMNSTRFYMDCLSLLPLDFLYLSLGYRSILRCFRLTKVYKGYAFVEKTERHTNYPNVLRGVLLLHAILLIFHWNACLVYALRSYLTFPSQFWDVDDKFFSYLTAYYLSCRTLIMVDTLPRPKDKSKVGMTFIIGESVAALVIFASVLGQVAGIVANVSAGRKQFQAQLDSVKTYMRLRKVPHHLQRKVVRWFDYWWSTKKYGNDGAVLDLLPDKLKAEIAIHVHLDTLKRVEIFRNTEPGFLCELVLKLRPMLFSPGDYVCRKGEVGNEMYIVSVGRLHVLADDGITVLATLKAGSYFGEISVLNMGTEGNRRTASVVSVGYSDLFCLSKRDIWEVLQDYPAARNRLELIAQKRLHQKLAHKVKTTATAMRSPLTTKLSDSSQRRGSAPAAMHFNTNPFGPSRCPSPHPLSSSVSKLPDINRPKTIRRFGPAAAFSRYSNPMKRPPAALAASSGASDEASTLCGIDDMNEETLAKSDCTQLLLQMTSIDSPAYGGQFSNDALVLSPDTAPAFIDESTATIASDQPTGTAKNIIETISQYSDESQTIL